MFCITLQTHDPYFNLAIEEIFLKNRTEDYLILSINAPSLIIGKHQSPHKEISTKYAHEQSIPVIRRISGGGTVYHDTGNLNFTFIKQSEPGKQVDFRKYTQPVIDFLSFHGIDAKFEGKNDLKINGLKISGNAEHVHRNRVLHHGTLLFNSSLDSLRNSLRKNSSNYTSRAVGSNPSSVTNLSDKLPVYKDVYEFRTGMMSFLMEYFTEAKAYELSEQEIAEAVSLADSKYRSWEWTWAYGPEYQFVNNFEFSGKQVSCRLIVKEGTIRDCILEGSADLASLAGRLIGCRHMVADLLKVLQEENNSISDIDVFNFF